MGSAHEISKLPDSTEAELARASASELSRLLAETPDTPRARVSLDGYELILPRHALALLRDLLAEMAQGNAVTIVPTHAELTTQEAANLLNVSRPHLVKLLETGEIRFTVIGTHRRVLFQDVIDYKQAKLEKSSAAMDELIKQSQELDMGY